MSDREQTISRQIESQPESTPPLEPANCFACSPSNPRGLQLEFVKGAGGEMAAVWIPDEDLEGYRGIVHGGLVSTVLDESMAQVVASSGCDALTAELRVRFRRQVQSGSPVQVRGWIESSRKRMLRTEASLATLDGEELAHAWATFLSLK